MSFLDDLEKNNKKQEQNDNPDKSQRDLFEGCFKYFNQFCSILKNNEQLQKTEFNFLSLNCKRNCQLVGPFEIKRISDKKNVLKLEFKMITQLLEPIKIKRKDERSASYLQIKLSRDGIQSVLKKDKDEQLYVQIKEQIPSYFHILLENDDSFFIEYININISNKRKIKLPLEKINEQTMDELAKYILGQNPDLYTESISDEEKQQIREKIAEINKQKEQKEAVLKEELKEQQRLEEFAKENSLKAKTKRYITKQSKSLGANLLKKINQLKNKQDK